MTAPVPPCSARHTATLEAMAEALRSARRPYVSCSGGKDSMVMAWLAVQLDPQIEIIHSTHGAVGLPPRWPRILVQALHSMGALNVRVDHRNLIAASRTLAADGHDLVLVGLRRAESQRRAERMESTPQLGAIPELWPLADWTTDDVWRCIDAHKIPYPSLYDAAGKRSRSWRMHWPETLEDRLLWGTMTYRHVPEPPLGPDHRAPDDVRWAQADGRWRVRGHPDVVVPGSMAEVVARDGTRTWVVVGERRRRVVADLMEQLIPGLLTGLPPGSDAALWLDDPAAYARRIKDREQTTVMADVVHRWEGFGRCADCGRAVFGGWISQGASSPCGVPAPPGWGLAPHMVDPCCWANERRLADARAIAPHISPLEPAR